jgi:hypothetical protein
MGAESVVKAAVVYDVSQMQEGVAQTVEGLQEMAQQATVTSETMMSKSQAMAKAAKDAAGTITEADLLVAETTKAATLAKTAQVKALRDVTKGAGDSADAIMLLAAAQRTARATAMEMAAANEAVAVSAGHSVTNMQATSGAIRSFEGNAGIRAVEAFVSKTLGLGPAMQAIFPLVGALAFGTILFNVGEKAVEMYEKAANGAKNTKQDFDDLHDKAQINIDDLRIENDKLDEQILKLGGHPGDGLQTALDEARKMADKLLDSLQADRKALDELLKKNDTGAFASAITGVASTGKQNAELIEDQNGLTKQVRAAKDAFEKTVAEDKSPAALKAATDVRNTAIKGFFDAQIATYRTEAQRLKNEQDETAKTIAADPTGAGGGTSTPINNSKKIANIEGRVQQLSDASNVEQLEQLVGAKQITVGKMKQDNAGADAKAPTPFKDELAQKEADERAYAQFHEELTRNFEAGYRQEGEAAHKVSEQQRADAEQFKRDQAAKIQAIGEVAQAAITTATEKAAVDAEAVSAKLAEGTITKLGAAKQLAAIHTAEYTAKLKALKDALDALSDGYGGSIDPKKSDQVQNQITKTQGEKTVASGKDTAAQTAAVSAPYLAAFNQINSGWLKLQNDLISGNHKIGQDFRKMELSLVESAAASVEKMLANQLRMEIRKIVAHVAANQAAVASDGAAAAQSDGISLLSAIKQVGHNASVAASKAFAANSGIPPAPMWGVIAGAAAYAGVMALAAFEMGGVVGGQPGMAVPILAHSGERVLSGSQTTNFERMVNNSSTGGSTMHNHFGGNSFRGGGGDFKSQWGANEKHIATSIKRMHREGKLKMA